MLAILIQPSTLDKKQPEQHPRVQASCGAASPTVDVRMLTLAAPQLLLAVEPAGQPAANSGMQV
jgi:hypothetical protein